MDTPLERLLWQMRGSRAMRMQNNERSPDPHWTVSPPERWYPSVPKCHPGMRMVSTISEGRVATHYKNRGNR